MDPKKKSKKKSAKNQTDKQPQSQQSLDKTEVGLLAGYDHMDERAVEWQDHLSGKNVGYAIDLAAGEETVESVVGIVRKLNPMVTQWNMKVQGEDRPKCRINLFKDISLGGYDHVDERKD